MQATPDEIHHAALALLRGELVAFPTETVYGLSADAASPDAVAKIYAAKGRPSDHPVIVHVAKPEDIGAWCTEIPAEAWQLTQAFWPGPLTLILQRQPWVDASVSGGQDTIGLRCPSHPVAHALLGRFAQLKADAGEKLAGVAAPSANRFGRVSPTRAEHVEAEFPELVAAGMPVLEGGDSEVGIESTIVDLSALSRGGQIALLRPGAITATEIAAVLGQAISGQTPHSPRVSGSLKAHYAPSTPLILSEPAAIGATIQAWLHSNQGRLAVMARFPLSLEDSRVMPLMMPVSSAAYARDLYATLRRIDNLGVAAVIVEQVPEEIAWDGVRDRLARAAATFANGASAV